MSRAFRSSARLLDLQVHLDGQKAKNVTNGLHSISEQNFEVGSSGKVIKRERPFLEQTSNPKSSKSDCLTPDIIANSRGVTKCDIESRRKYQNLVQEVYLYGSYAQHDVAQSGSPKTPILSHSSAQHISQFMESFARAFPLECKDLMILLDAFMERRLYFSLISLLSNCFDFFCRTAAICMRISSFFQNFDIKHDKLGLSNVINEIASRFQELASKASVDFSSESHLFPSSNLK